MRRIAILGGGISGLSAAFYLEQARRNGAAIEYKLFEGGPRTGGVLRTEQRDGFLLEQGAEAFLTQKSAAIELCRELGIEDQLLGSNDDNRKTYVLANGKLIPLPEGLVFVVPASKQAQGWELFSESTRQQFAREREFAPREASADENAAAFLERHFGAEAVRWLGEPMLAGIYGGDAARLSAQAALPTLVAMERKHGSLLAACEASSAGTKDKAPIFTTLKHGMQQLTDALAAALPAEAVQLECSVRRMMRAGDGWRLGFGCGGGGRDAVGESFDALIVALPAWAAAGLLRPVCATLATQLEGIEYTSSVTVALAYGAEKQVSLPAGFGFLVPSGEGKRALAGTFCHQKFCGRASEGGALLRIFFGGAHDESAMEMADGELQALAQKELRAIVGITAEPDLCLVTRWPRAMPQYNLGHLQRLAAIEELAVEQPGLQLVGSAYRGVGIPDCIAAAKGAVARLLQ